MPTITGSTVDTLNDMTIGTLSQTLQLLAIRGPAVDLWRPIAGILQLIGGPDVTIDRQRGVWPHPDSSRRDRWRADSDAQRRYDRLAAGGPVVIAGGTNVGRDRIIAAVAIVLGAAEDRTYDAATGGTFAFLWDDITGWCPVETAQGQLCGARSLNHRIDGFQPCIDHVAF